jgi:hypothetical protein
MRLVTRDKVSHSGVSVGDSVAGSSFDVTSTESARSPSASRSISSAWSPVWPGSVRMSTSRSTRSGITFVFVPPCTTVGANVVCVHACQWRAMPSGSSESALWNSSESRSAPAISGSSCMPSMKRRQESWIWVSGRYSAIRRTTSAAVTSALSVRNGCEPCPGVPRTVSFDQNVPFSPTTTGRRGPTGVGTWKPPDSVST